MKWVNNSYSSNLKHADIEYCFGIKPWIVPSVVVAEMNIVPLYLLTRISKKITDLLQYSLFEVTGGPKGKHPHLPLH